MSKLVLKLITVLSILFINHFAYAGEMFDWGLSLSKLIEANPKYQKAVLQTINLQIYGRCVPLVTVLIVDENNGEKLSKTLVTNAGILMGATAYFRKYTLANGMREVDFDNATLPYLNEWRRNEESARNRYIPMCMDIAYKFAKMASQ